MEEQSSSTPHRPPVGRRPIYQLIVIGTIAAAIGIAAGLLIDWFPVQAASQAHKIDTLYHVLIVVTVPIFVLVQTVVLFSVWKFRVRPGEERLDGPPIHGNTRLEIVWTALPAMLIAALCVYAFIVLHDIERKPAAQEMVINVTGQQFAWSFQYPASAGGHSVVSDQLYLAKDQPVRFRIHSVDVIHAFWIPAFRIQEDAVPGVTTTYRVTPDRLGTYEVICNELCGLGHALMRSQVHVVTRSQFDAWLAARGGAATAASGSPSQVAATGKRVFLGSSSCGACHALADAHTSGQVGPNLDTALKGKARLFIRAAIVNPYAHLPKGYGPGIMPPNYGSTLTNGEIDALTGYLAKVTK